MSPYLTALRAILHPMHREQFDFTELGLVVVVDFFAVLPYVVVHSYLVGEKNPK